MNTVLITGISGFAGSHLAEYLLQAGYRVCGIDLQNAPAASLAELAPDIKYFAVDLLDQAAVRQVVAKIRPEWVFHLAGISNVPYSWKQRKQTIQVNVFGCFHLLEALRELNRAVRVLVAGSGAQYGVVAPDAQPISENTPLRPDNPYSVSKCMQENLCYLYRAAIAAGAGMEIILVRLFNHIGPRQSPDFVTAAFARQIARIEAGLCEPVIRVGNLEARRDFTDIRDMIRAYHLMIARGQPFVPYNMASGSAYAIREILDALLSMARVPIREEADPDRLRPSDNPVICGDPTQMMEITGWRPQIPIRESLRRILNYWREQVRSSTEDCDP